jgi:hypothetical protein
MLMRPSLMPLLGWMIAVVLGLTCPAHADGRIALVIGNSAYTKVPSLPNPAHDARDVATALERLGFSVKTVTDVDFDRMRRSLLEFGRAAPNADMAILYFAGHGVEIDGDNWLLPTDVELKYDTDASTEAIGLPAAIQAVAAARMLGLVILDACRNNPFKSSMRKSNPRASTQILGLAPVEPATNVLVAYAARDGTVANDGTGRNSPYTAALLKHLETPGLEIDFLFRNVRDDVMAATNNEQQPFIYGSLSSEEIYLKTLPAGETVVEEMPPPDAAEIAWSFLRVTSDVLTLARFIDRFPASTHVADARMRIATLAMANPRGAGLELMPLARPVVFTDTEFEEAEKAVARRFVRDTPAVAMAWDVVRETRDHTMIRRFIERFPRSTRRAEADTRLAALGQMPVTVHAASRQPLEVDDAVLTEAAAHPDVQQCFRQNDQTDDKCRKAFQRFPDISRFVEDHRFTVAFCQTMGNPGGCVPTVKTAWNFPRSISGGSISGGSSPGGGNAGTGGAGAGTPPPGSGSPGSGNAGAGNPGGGNINGSAPASGGTGNAGGANGGPGSGTGGHRPGAAAAGGPRGRRAQGLHGIALRPPEHAGEPHPSADGAGAADARTTDGKATPARPADGKTTGMKPGSPKVSTAAAPKAPAVAGPGAAPDIKTPNVKTSTPNVKVNPPRVNIRVPNLDIHVH